MPTPTRYVEVDQLGPAAHRSPLRLTRAPGRGLGQFVAELTLIRHEIEFVAGEPKPSDERDEEMAFEKAGPREQLYFDPAKTRAAIVTCGGLCPGLNNVIRSLFLELHFNYGVHEVLGIRHGYLGLNPEMGARPVQLTRDWVSSIHREGGTHLGTSRGPQEPRVIVEFLEREEIDILFCVGGDGTQRGAHAIAAEVEQRGGRPISVIGIPKTIDSDLLFCDRTFGYSTAIEKAREVIHLAHTEAKDAVRGIGLVKLMGRTSGFIACGATLVSQEVNFAIVPETPLVLDGPHGFLAALERRMNARGHAVIAVAEGAAQDLFPPCPERTDASGNLRLHDVGPLLKQRIVEYFTERHQPVDVKYIDPSYIIRSVPANCDDSVLCDSLARNAAHAAMAGRTNVMIGLRHGAFIHVPIPMAVKRKRKVDLEGDLWTSVLAATGQPARWGESK